MPPVTSLVRTRLMVSVTASKLGECRNTNSASRPVVLVVLPNCIVILPLSSHNRRSCAGASHGIFYFALHTYLENEFLGSQGTYLASRETLIASVEAERSWDEVRLVACPMKADFCSTTTEVLAIETFLCFRVWSTGLPPESSSSNFPSQNEWPNFWQWWAQDSDRCVVILSPYCGRRHFSLAESPSYFPLKINSRKTYKKE